MKQRQRIYYSTEQRREIWDRWKRGESALKNGGYYDVAFTAKMPTIKTSYHGHIERPVRALKLYGDENFGR